MRVEVKWACYSTSPALPAIQRSAPNKRTATLCRSRSSLPTPAHNGALLLLQLVLRGLVQAVYIPAVQAVHPEYRVLCWHRCTCSTDGVAE